MKQLNLLAEFDACELQNAPNDGQNQNGNNGTIANGHEYVDLGLSVKWATCNVGETTPEGYGKCLAWGETEPKLSYYSNTYKWMYKYKDKSDTTLVKYCTLAAYGQNNFTDDKSVLDPEDDAATVLWGGKWRMPTDDEWTELREKCTWKRRTVNGIQGYMVKSKINDNSIFLPAAGYHIKVLYREGIYWRKSFDAGDYGYYWSSSLCTDYAYDAWSVDVESKYVSRDYDYRYNDKSVRPVIKID